MISVSIPQWCDCCMSLWRYVAIALWFQSHNGAIAAITVAGNSLLRCWFQSHNGAIAALYSRRQHYRNAMFQSHNGAIAALVKSEEFVGDYKFQSHNGAIAAVTDIGRHIHALDVSIPQWCDCCLLLELVEKSTSSSFNPTMVRLLRLPAQFACQ